MKLLLIAPASGRWREVGRTRWFNGKMFRFSLLSLLRVAAETPADWNIRVVDEQIEDIPWEDDVDLVGITCMTAAAPRAFELARRFRSRGVPVVLGGMYPTLCPQEALSHADGIVVGDAEGLWPRVIDDFRAGLLGGVYRHGVPPQLDGLKPAPRHLLAGHRYATVHAVQATRGCPNRCDFCAVSAFNGHTQRRRPVADVVREVAAIPAKTFIFIDDHLTADPEYARALFEALIPLGKRWITQSTLAMAQDEGMVALAADAGCVGVFVGLETVSNANLHAVDKAFHRAERYAKAIEVFHAYGIGVEAGIVFGFDGDDAHTFQRTLHMLDRWKVDAIQVSILTPIPGTRRYEKTQDRLVDRDLSHYDFHHVVFKPNQMSAQDLQAGHDWVTRQFYRPHRILRRLWRHLWRPNGCRTLPFVCAINLAYLGRVVRWKIRGFDPAKTRQPSRRLALQRSQSQGKKPCDPAQSRSGQPKNLPKTECVMGS